MKRRFLRFFETNRRALRLQPIPEDAAVTDPDQRPLRADAQRNRDKLLAAALAAFTERADAPLEGIAKQAGVGIGTLYRHFPTREALIEQVYRAELDRLCDAAPHLLTTSPPEVALRRWMDLFLEYLDTKRGLADALRAVITGAETPFPHARKRLLEALGVLVDAAVRTGALRDDVPALDVLVGMAGIANATDDAAQAGRLLDLLVAGLRAGR